MAANDIVGQQPGDDALCMLCNSGSKSGEALTLCTVCQAPWHQPCLVLSRESHFISDDDSGCPECQNRVAASSFAAPENTMISKILAIQADKSLTEEEKARRRQELVSGRSAVEPNDNGEETKGKVDKLKDKAKVSTKPNDQASKVSDESFNCSICLNMPERPVTTPCGHNFCLKCFQQSIRQGKRNCALCRKQIPATMANQPRINLMLVSAIRMAKMLKSNGSGDGSSKACEYVHNQDRPDKAYTTERAKRSGKANAASGRIFVTVPTDHFGPILAENDPERNRGVLVGDTWEDRLECRQWGGHFPPIKGIAGQKEHGAQSVVLSGGYKDDEDHGEWFLYTGSGGRDLSGNKRTNKDQSFDQEFKSGNEALRLSCKNGHPLRVIRSHKDKHSSYAPEKGLRYDGIYRVEKCWRNVGVQGYKVCRYLFVRCDNDPAPWTSDLHGDRPRPLPVIKELEHASDITERKESPSWGFDEVDGCWKWMKPPPPSKQKENAGVSDCRKRPRSSAVVKQATNVAARKRLQKEFGCGICEQVLDMPITTPCGHNFCKSCLEGAFAGKSSVRERKAGGRSLRSQKNVMKCPAAACTFDLSDYLNNFQVNIELKNLIAKQMSEYEDSKSGIDDEPVDPEMELSPENPSKKTKVDADNQATFVQLACSAFSSPPSSKTLNQNPLTIFSLPICNPTSPSL
ncbi:hypothetical protein V6N12_043886 [Hibiscus sabdariffa]|uniref:RING-type E3 ubiquitin transferase n=1 Tax=Hibiscus sabdariffa TaxID=183260 RepID=A0ABR2DFN0_9ROSI